MRQSCLTAAIGSALLLLASPAIARDAFEIPTSFPKTYEDLYKVIKGQTADEKKELEKDTKKKEDTEKENIPAYLGGAQCGGWYANMSVEGKIATVTNAPGHTGQWNGNIPSGMASRDANLTYPNDTQGVKGLATACDPETAFVQKTAWSDAAQARVPSAVSNPLFKDPPCLWSATGAQLNPQSPEKCQAFCSWTNGFLYDDCRPENLRPVVNAKGVILSMYCGKWEQRYVCSDEWASPDARGNCTQCTGASCGCDGTQASCLKSAENGKPYVSFYRNYSIGYARDRVLDKDDAVKNGSAACYGLYAPFDTRSKQTEAKDMNCIIDLDMQNMKESQKGKGEYGQNSNFPDPEPQLRSGGKINLKTATWYTNLGQAFEFLNNTETTDKEKPSLSESFGALFNGNPKATVQLTQAKPLAEHSYTRAFDETAESRTLSTWWQEQQTRLQTYVHGPVLRLVLPSAWAIGASTDPFLKDATVVKKETTDKRSQTIEVQLDAEPGTFDEVIDFAQRSSTLQVTEDPVPIIIPLADPVELRSTAASWCAWAAASSADGTCNDAPEKVKKLMADLRKYADDMEEYRSLRTLLSDHTAEILKLQNDVTKPLTDWMKTNVAKYKETVAARKKIATDVAPTLDYVQQLLQKFNNVTNMPWCMNQRFTLPIFSLLDPWLPSRKNEGAISAEGLPSFPKPDAVPQDIVIDMSRLSYVQSPVSIAIPQVIQVRLDIPVPPNVDAIKNLPPIGKEMEKIKTAMQQAKAKLPKVQTKGSPPSISLPDPPKPDTVQKMKEAADQIFTMFNTMDRTYGDFWDSIGPFTPEKDWTEADKKLAEQKKKLECTAGTFPCVHVEMDLLERLTRIASRPLIMLNEDYDSKGVARATATACEATDHVCLLMHPEQTKPVQGWEIRGPTAPSVAGFLDSIRTSITSLTFPPKLGSADRNSLPPYDATESQRAEAISPSAPSPLLPENRL